MRRIYVISDLQVPYMDRRAVDAVALCIADTKATDDMVVSVGDEMDFQTISKYAQGGALEWERSIGKDRDLTHQILKDLQVKHISRSNHCDRLWLSITRRLPGLIGAPELELENFLRLPELGITYHREAFQMAPNTLLLHGDEAGVSQVGGSTAAGLVRRTGMNVVCGHSHRQGYQPVTFSYNGNLTRTLFGMEVGHLTDMKSSGMQYVRTHNWQQGWAVVYVDQKNVYPVLIPITNKSFVFEGVQYSW
jgi:hypothetical protein